MDLYTFPSGKHVVEVVNNLLGKNSPIDGVNELMNNFKPSSFIFSQKLRGLMSRILKLVDVIYRKFNFNVDLNPFV